MKRRFALLVLSAAALSAALQPSRLDWTLKSAENGAHQTAYRLLVASSAAATPTS